MNEKQKNILIERIARELLNQLLDELDEIEVGSYMVKKTICDRQDWRELLHDDACWMTCADMADCYNDAGFDDPTDEMVRNDVREYINATRDGYGKLYGWMPENE